jgi:hypothetical protein
MSKERQGQIALNILQKRIREKVGGPFPHAAQEEIERETKGIGISPEEAREFSESVAEVIIY